MNFYELQLLAPICFITGLFFHQSFVFTINQITFFCLYTIIGLLIANNYEYSNNDSFCSRCRNKIILFFTAIQTFTIKKLIFFLICGIFIGFLQDKQNEIYSYKTTQFQANILDIHCNDSEMYLILDQFIFISNKNNIEKIDQNPKFPKTAQMKIQYNTKNICKNIHTGQKIIAIGRFLLPMPSHIPQKQCKKIPNGIINEFKIKQNSKQTIKEKLREKFDNNLSKTSAQFAKAMFLADTFAISKQNRENFQQAGIAHLLGVSVLNIGILASIFYFLIRYLVALLFYKIALLIPLNIIGQIGALIIIYIYCLVVGFEYPVLRSLFMSSIGLIAFYFGRNRSQEILLWSASIILAIWPDAIFDLGFQLSFASVLGLCNAKHITLKHKIADISFKALQSTFFASLITIPLSIYQFQTASLQPFLANIIAIPFTAFCITPINLIWSILAFFDLEPHSLSFILDKMFLIFAKIASYTAPFGLSAHVDPIEKTGCLILLLCVTLFGIFKENFRYIFLPIGVAAFVASIILQPSKPFILVHPYAIGLILQKQIIVYPKVNFIGKMWGETYNLSCIDGKNTKYFTKDQSGKIIINVNNKKIGLVIGELKTKCKIKTTKTYYIPFAELTNKTQQIIC